MLVDGITGNALEFVKGDTRAQANGKDVHVASLQRFAGKDCVLIVRSIAPKGPKGPPDTPTGVAAFMSVHSKTPRINPSVFFPL